MSESPKTTELNFEALADQAVASLVAYLVLIEDPRGRQGSLHKFVDILAIRVFGTICSCDEAEKLEEWAAKEEEWLQIYLELRNGTPSQDTYLLALAAMNPQTFRTVFQKWAGDIFFIMAACSFFNSQTSFSF